jgi:uncharacterized protein YydD (DUF2326 family)
MIVSIGSSLPSFKTVKFHAGLNILLSTKSANSDGHRTRNSAGKSSLVEIVHFLMGAKANADSLLRHKALVDHAFFGIFRIGDLEMRVERSGAKPSQIVLDRQLIERLGLTGKTDKKSGNAYVSNETWKQFLGHRFFGLPDELKGSAFEPSFTPSFRSMFSYFARRDGSGGYVHPEKQAEAQSRWDWQENLSYLLDLDWRVPHQLQLVRQREGQLDELKKAAKGGALGSVIGTVAELRPELVQAQDRAARLRDDTARFRVHDAYSAMMEEATAARTEMQAILRREVPLRETVTHIEEALAFERIPDPADVARVYQSVGIELPDTARRRFADVEKFHRSVVENRSLRLREEMESAQRKIADGQKRVAQLDEIRGAILQSIEGQGALEDFIALQERLAAAEAEAAALAERYKAAEALESENTQLTIDRASIKRRLQDDHQVRHDQIDYAIRLIGGLIRELYGDRRGNFEVEATENGPEFRISIEGDRGGGIASMEIFCLDLALFVIWSSKGAGPGFLMHDSHLFDGVDARQIAIAIKTAGEMARNWGVQYIVALNSDIFDTLPWPEGFDPGNAVVTPTLSDADETGGLFGLRFD